MEIVEVSAEEYKKIIRKDTPVFSRKEFLELNSDKVDCIYYLVGEDTKRRFAFAVGSKQNEWLAPFSAPFSNIVLLRESTTVEQIWDFINVLNKFAQTEKAKSINIYLPANVYDEQTNARIINALLGNGYKMLFWDINYSFDLKKINLETYSDDITHMARKNLKIALNNNLHLFHCDKFEDKVKAYNIIKTNREYRGFPLRMTQKQLMETVQIVEHDFFIVEVDGKELAAAVVYHLTKDVAQVVYWGNIPDTEHYKPINFLAYKLIEFYKKLNFRLLDVGISTEGGKPNFGLCAFKESLGCTASMKSRFLKEFL